jgi:hypothetical protein
MIGDKDEDLAYPSGSQGRQVLVSLGSGSGRALIQRGISKLDLGSLRHVFAPLRLRLRRGRGDQASHQAQDLPAQPEGQSLDEPLIVSIDLSEIAFT